MTNWDKEFEEILGTCQSHIRAYVAGFGVPFYHTDDIAQDVFIHYFKEFSKKPDDVEPIRWLKGIAKNYCLRYFDDLKKEKSKNEKLKLIASLMEGAKSDFQEEGETKKVALLKVCLSKLSDKNLQLIKMKYEDGHSYQKLSNIFDLSSQAVGMLLLRIRNSLKKCIKGGALL
ncbi:MAG: hypothetical protein COA79_22815 [Planctomycetota bacterium]|nr:MAG: hypothetical protein COA79_22815 [Planctomycetota bacterium]